MLQCGLLFCSFAARAFPLHDSEDDEVKISWESLWSDLFPSNSAGIERDHRQLSAELPSIFNHSNSRTTLLSAAGEGPVPHSMCDELRRISEQHRWVWGSLESLPGVGVAAIRSSLRIGSIRYLRQ